VAVVAGGAVRLGGVGAGTSGRVAGARLAALIRRGADDRVRAGADARLAGIGPGAGAAVVAGRAVGLARGGAGAFCRVAGAGVMALVDGGADDRVRTDAGAAEAGIALGAEVAVLARREIGECRVGAAGGGIAAVGGAAIAVVAVGRRPAHATSPRAGVGRGAGVARVARGRVVRLQAAAEGVAGVVGARIAVIAGRVRDDHAADARLARVGGAEVVVVTNPRRTVDADAGPDGANPRDLHECVGRRACAIIRDRGLVARLAVRHEELGVVQGCYLEAYPVVGERIEKSGDGRFLLGAKAESEDRGVEILDVELVEVAAAIVELEDLLERRHAAVVEVGGGQLDVPERRGLEGAADRDRIGGADHEVRAG